MPPASAAQGGAPNPDRGLGLSLLLGNDYDRKKNKLQRELQLDYQNYVAKKKDLKTTEPRPQPQGLSLPIDDKISVQEKLREERKKEYNLFLQGQAQIRRLRKGSPPITSKPGQVQATDAVCNSPPPPILNAYTHLHPPPRERTAFRRDTATLTEAVDNGKRAGTRGPVHQARRRWQLKEPYNSEEEPITDKEEEFEFRQGRRRDRYTPEPEYKEERRERRANRAPQDTKTVEAPSVHDRNNNEWVWKSDLQMPGNMRTAVRSRPATSKDKAEFATGLMIGATEEQTASQMKKERYKQELLTQIAEQQRNKIREKKLELRVAATGATDPEKEPDRIKPYGATNRRYDSRRRDVPYRPRVDLEAVGKEPDQTPKDDKPPEDAVQGAAPPGKSHVVYGTALSQLRGRTEPDSATRATQGVPSLDYFNEDYHRDFSNMLGEVAIPSVAGAPPPVPPTVTNDYKTPYDAAYFYYGSRNPLDPNPPYSQIGERVQKSGNFHNPPQRPPPLRPSGRTEATDQHRASPLDGGELPADKSKQRRESVLSYSEALRQQIKEREECKRREKEEKERYDAKIEAEMMAYNPWGRSGGGAPIKDQKGNLVSDLHQMHRYNEESYRNPLSRNSGSLRNGHTPRAEARAPLSHRLSGFSDQPTPQQPHRQEDRYREELKQQIEENKRKQQEERDRIKAEEQKEEKRLADQRARIQREYEEEQKKKKVEQRLENRGVIHEPKTQHQEEEKKVRQEEEIEQKLPESARDREEKKMQLNYELQREPSPPIPTLQRRQTDLVPSRPSSVLSQLSSRTGRSVSAPHSRPVPQLPDGRQEVIRELSTLRRFLRKQQRQMEVELGQAGRQESHYTPPNRPRGRPRVDAFESQDNRAVQPSARSRSSDSARVNMQNIREFNQLKYRDTASREEVRHMYPDPPTDEHSLDIQQQALLREQQRKLRLMKREEEPNFLDQQLSHHHPRNKPGRYIHKDSILPSETSFIDFYSGDACEDRVDQQPQPSAEHRERTAPRRRPDNEVSVNQRNRNIQPDAPSLQSAISLNLESKVRAHEERRTARHDPHTGDHNTRQVGLSGDEVDVLSLSSALGRRVSVETVATEPWLRPGTSDAVKRSGCRERPDSRMDAPPWLTHRVT